MKNLHNTIDLNNMDRFTGKLKKEDDRNLRISRNFQWLMWVMSLLYAYVFIFRGWDENTLYGKLGWSLYVLAFLTFGFIFNYLKKSYQQINYGLPTLTMLQEAAKRYKLFQRKLILAITPILFIDAGMVLVTFDPVNHESIWRAFWLTQALLIPSVGIGLAIGIYVYRKRQKPLRDAALRMIEELEH